MIADTGATIHNALHRMGMAELRKGGREDSLTVGNGEKVDLIEVGSIEGVVTDRKGKEVAKVKLKEVILLSITKMMKDGWIVKGSINHLAIEKNNVIVSFNIIIKTREGMFFCMNIQRNADEINGATIDISKDKAHRMLGHSG